MNRAEFMRQLESLLQNISPSEREEALQYYNDYFNDAGSENEQAVIEALGNPAKVAENIKSDLYGGGAQRAQNSGREMVEYGKGCGGAQTQPEKEKMSTGMIVLIVILCVLASPVALGLAGGLVGALGGVLAAWFTAIVGFGVTAVVLLILFVVIGVAGLFSIFYSPMVGLGLIGGALVCGGFGILFMMLTVAMAGIATPAICKGIAGLCRSLFGKKEGAK